MDVGKLAGHCVGGISPNANHARCRNASQRDALTGGPGGTGGIAQGRATLIVVARRRLSAMSRAVEHIRA